MPKIAIQGILTGFIIMAIINIIINIVKKR